MAKGFGLTSIGPVGFRVKGPGPNQDCRSVILGLRSGGYRDQDSGFRAKEELKSHRPVKEFNASCSRDLYVPLYTSLQNNGQDFEASLACAAFFGCVGLNGPMLRFRVDTA